MKKIHTPILFAGLLAAAAINPASSASANIGDILRGSPTPADLIQLETLKWDYFFGTPEQKQELLSWYSPDYINVGYTGPAPERFGYEQMGALMPFIPQLPPGSFQVTDVLTVKPREGTLVVSYKVAGPGPVPGVPFQAFIMSVWAKREGGWLTTFYQASQIPN